jgi:cellulose biosynthesis protein BcsQ
MKVVTIAAPKGGSCKTTTTTLLAVKAVQDRQRVCLIDLNADQANLAQWHTLRDSPANPHLEQDITNITRDVQVIRASKHFDWLFIDTPPLDMDLIENAVIVSDAVVVPVRASIFDIGAIDSIVEMCRGHRKPFSFLLSAVDSRFKPLNATASVALAGSGPLFRSRISYRLPYINAVTAGKAGFEIERDLQSEADALWMEVKTLANGSASPHIETVVANDR